MKLKTELLNGVAYAVVVDGKPVYINDDGKEVAFDAPATVQVISRLNGEAKGHREGKEAAELALKNFAGIEDPEAARKALDTVKNLASGELTSAAKVQEIKDAAKRAAEEQVSAAAKTHGETLARVTAERDGFQTALFDEKIGGSFSRSKFIDDKLAIPGDIARAVFGKSFKVEEGKIVAFDTVGNKIFSRGRPGEVADFDEAMEVLVDAYPQRDRIMKGSGASGGGSQGGAAQGGKPTITRAQFNSFDPAKQASVAKDAAAGKAVLVD